MHRLKRLFGCMSRPKASDTGASNVGHGGKSDSAHQTSGPAPHTTGEGPSATSRSFKSLIERSITAWNSLTYVGDAESKDADFKLLSGTLRGFDSIDDLFRSRIMFWFFQRRESIMKQNQFLKWDPSRLDEYVLLPVAYGFVNKRDCFYVSHFWRTEEHPDPRGEDFRLVHGDLANQSWAYVWVDWTCLPQSPRSKTQTEYATKMLYQASILMRNCGFEWRYPDFQPRLWILVEVAQYMLTTKNYTTTPDMEPFINDVLAMEKEGVRHIIRQCGYKCSIGRHYRLLVGWLELLIIMSKLVPNVSLKRSLLDSLDHSMGSSWKEYGTGIEVDMVTGIVSHNKSVYRFAPLWPVGEDGLLEVITEPSRCEPPACVDKIIEIMQHPELSEAKRQLMEKEQALGMYHADTIANVGKLADVFIKLEQYREAEELRRRVLTSLQKTLGPEHPKTLDAINKVGATLHMQKRYDESKVLFHQYLDGMGRYTGN